MDWTGIGKTALIVVGTLALIAVFRRLTGWDVDRAIARALPPPSTTAPSTNG